MVASPENRILQPQTADASTSTPKSSSLSSLEAMDMHPEFRRTLTGLPPGFLSDSLPGPHLFAGDQVVEEPGPFRETTYIEYSPSTPFIRPIIKQLPEEILHIIFRHCSSPSQDGFNAPLKASQPPLTLRLVCYNWKSIADKYIWRAINPGTNFSCDSQYLDRITLYQGIIKDQKSIDNVSLVVAGGYPVGDGKMIRTIASAFVKSRAVKIELPDWLLESSFFIIDPQSGSHSTQHFTPIASENLRVFSWKSNSSLSTTLPSNLGLPWMALRNSRQPQFCVPWYQLTEINLDCQLSLADCIHILEQGREALEVAQLSCICHDSPSESVLIPVLLKRLTNLSVVSSVADLGPLFNPFSFECLEALEVRSELTGIAEYNIPWQRLSHLRLEGKFSIEDARQVLVKCSRLKLFSLKGLLDPSPHPAPSRDLPPYIPHLTEVNIDTSSDHSSALIDLLISPRTRPKLIRIPRLPTSVSSKYDLTPITTLELLDPIETLQCYDILREAHSLEKAIFIIRDTISDTTASHSFPILKHQRLKSIRLTTPARGFLLRLELPAATEIVISCEDISITGAFSIKELSFILSKAILLRKFTLQDFYITEDQVLSCLETASSSLAELVVANTHEYLYSHSFSSTILQKLTHSSRTKSGCLCPQLETLTLSPCSFSKSNTAIIDMFTSRRRNDPICYSCGHVISKLERFQFSTDSGEIYTKS